MGVIPSESLQIATRIDPFDRVLNAAVPVRSRNAVRRASRNASLVKTRRRKVVRHLLKLSRTPEPMRVRINKMLPVNHPERSLHIPLIQLLAHSLDYPDLRLPSDLVKGMNILGQIPPANTLNKRRAKAATTVHRIKQGLKTRNQTMLRALTKSTNKILIQK